MDLEAAIKAGRMPYECLSKSGRPHGRPEMRIDLLAGDAVILVRGGRVTPDGREYERLRARSRSPRSKRNGAPQ